MGKKKPPAKQTYAPANASAPAQKRPSANSPIPTEVIDSIAHLLSQIKSKLEPYAAHLRPLDRKRLNSVSIKRQGFIERTYEYVMESPEFLPHYLTQQRFREDHEYFVKVRALYDVNKQTDEFLCNITVQASDMDYTNSLDYYAASREAAKRRVDGAETVYNNLEPFFKRKKAAGGKPAAKKIKSDINALSHGKRDGIVIVENVKPKLAGRKHKVIDEHFDDTARFQETEGGVINT